MQYQRTVISKVPDRNIRSTLKLPQISIGTMNIPARCSEHVRSSRLHTKKRDAVKVALKERPVLKQLHSDRTMPTFASLNSPRSDDDGGDSSHKSLFSFRRVIDTLSLRPSRRTSLDKVKEQEEQPQEEKPQLEQKIIPVVIEPTEQPQPEEKPPTAQPFVDEVIEEVRPKKESQSIRPKNESVSSQFTQLTDEIHSVWDNVDLYLRGVQFDEFDQQNQLQSFLMLYKMRSGGFPGSRENLPNEEVIRRAAEYAKGNRQVFKKYFPTKQVVFENEEDYTQSYDVNSDANFQKFQQYIKKYNGQQEA